MSAPPIPFRWEGDCFIPNPGFSRECDKHFVVGQVYRLIEQQDRSDASHRHYFACINTAWETLPERLSERFPTAEHLRKFALVKSGYADSRQLVASSKAEALRLAAFVRPMDEYAVVTVSESVVTVWTARTQNTRAMNRQDFQESKDAVLSIVAEMIGTTPSALAANAGQAA